MSAGPLVVIGDTLLDTDVEGTADRLCPDAPVPVVDVSARRSRPGGAGLAALLAARAGQDVVLVTALADDAAGAALTGLLGEHATVVAMPLAGSTVCKTRIRAAGQSLLRVDSGDGLASAGPVDAPVRAAIRSAGAVLVADYGRGVAAHPGVRELLASVARRVPVVWDPHPRGAVPVHGCRLTTPNEAEVTRFAAAFAAGTDAASAAGTDAGTDAADALRARWGCAALAMTRGARGALLLSAGGAEVLPVPGTAVPPGRDACGAGDAFAAAATGALLAGADVRTAVVAAVEAASGFVAAGGAGSLELAPGAPAYPPAGRLSARELAALVRRRGGRLVATGGCFDVLHPGHLSLLRQARALGDALVVCLNSDASVRRRKGPQRPVVPAADRVAMLEALAPVDAVAVFDEDTPAALLDVLRPAVWVKGGDYAVDDLPEAEVVHRHGGETVIVPMVEGYSTTRLLSALRAADGPVGARA